MKIVARMKIAATTVAAMVFASSAQAQSASCAAEIPCKLGDRAYHVLPPEAWDGVSALPVLLHFHGWGRQGPLIMKHGRIAGATSPRGVLLLAPNGLGKTWDFWQPGSRDSTFAAAVIEDAAKTYPIDRNKIFVSGYSYGSAMAWRFACESGDGVRALLAVSGTLNQAETCDTAPAEIRHVHGTKDTVMDFPFGPGGDTTYPVALWRDRLGCAAPTGRAEYSTTDKDHFARTIWEACSKGKVVLDVHARGHFIPRGWFAYQLDELLTASGDNPS